MALKQEMDRLRGAPIFACLDDEALRLVAFSAEPRRLAPGDIVYRKGEPAAGAVLIVSGTLAIGDGENGGSTRRAGPGTLLEETALLASAQHHETATVTEAAVVMAVSRSSLLRAIEVYPVNAVQLRRYWAARLGRRLGRFRAAVRP